MPQPCCLAARTLCGALSFALAMMTAALAQQPPGAPAGLPPLAERPAGQGPMYITPNVEGLLFCEGAAHNHRLPGVDEALAFCLDAGKSADAALRRLLDTLEPGGPQGKVQVGYTLTVPLLSLYEKKGGQWHISDRRADAFLRLIEQVRRPVVVYLMATHFDSTGPLSTELGQDAANLLKLPDGKPPQLGYFGYAIQPFTLRTDEALPVNRYRFAALRYMARRLLALPEAARQRIVAITLAGEVHQLFPDFENGTGNYASMQVTDYDPASVAAFRAWLQAKYGSLAQLGQATGLHYASFDAIDAPARDIRREPLQHFGQHYDAYAGGTVPVAGWLWDPQQRVQALDLYVNGQRLAPIQRGFNRLDVYRALDEVSTPNVGFRHELDFSALPTGRHRLQVVATTAQGHKYLVGERVLVHVARNQAPVPNALPDGVQDLQGMIPQGRRRFLPAALQRLLVRWGWLQPLEPVGSLPGVRWWLDMPAALQDVYYNPLARDWNAFRTWQVQQFMHHFHAQALAAGLPADLLYSHQIVTRVNSAWNPGLFASDGTLGARLPWRPGFNLYGGAVQGAWLDSFLASHGIRDYGVPEFNPQQWKTPGLHLQALRTQYQASARFVSPMYMSVVPQRLRPPEGAGLSRLELRPDNPQEGAAAFYQAVLDMAKE